MVRNGFSFYDVHMRENVCPIIQISTDFLQKMLNIFFDSSQLKYYYDFRSKIFLYFVRTARNEQTLVSNGQNSSWPQYKTKCIFEIGKSGKMFRIKKLLKWFLNTHSYDTVHLSFPPFKILDILYIWWIDIFEIYRLIIFGLTIGVKMILKFEFVFYS